MAKYTSKYGARKSGCTMSKYHPKEGPNKGVEMAIFNAWMATPHGFLKITANTTGKTKVEQGKKYAGSIAVEIINQNTGSKSFYWGVLDVEKGKVRIPDLNWVLNPKAPNGGYAGKSGKPKN